MEAAMPRDRRMECSDAEVVPLAGRLRQRSRPAQDLPAARNLHFEELLCRAVAARLLVELRYDAEVEPRLFAPHLVYRSTTGRINVGGTQIHNPGQPEDSYEPRLFEVGLIRTLRLTDTSFRPDNRFRRDEPQFHEGVICAL
jgi:hypothetical protein